MSKYEYGVEYETNGEKPDLPDDVQVITVGERGGSDLGKTGNMIWKATKLFRIVDERYKPKSDESNWHERGELPPVKSTHKEFELIGLGYYKPEFEITAHHYNGVTAIVSVKSSEGVTLRNAKACHFRLIPTERDKLVDECVKILGDGALSGKVKSLRDQAELLVTRGWRSTEMQDETEFGYSAAKACRNIAVSDAIELYRAGCRFIERGDL